MTRSVEEAIEVYAEKPSSDGIAVGKNGAVYITNVDKSEITLVDISGTRTWAQGEQLIWPDGLFVAPDGSVVVTVNQLNRAAPFNEGESLAEKPYFILQITENPNIKR